MLFRKLNSLRISITEDCNLNCSYCCNKIPKISRKIKPVKLTKAQKMIKKYNDICITGGEPLLNKELLWHLIAYSKFYKKECYLYTNGILLTGELIEAMERMGVNGINIGIHDSNCDLLLTKLPKFLNFKSIFRLMMRADHPSFSKFIDMGYFVKTYKLNDCDMPKEKWIKIK